MYAYNPLSLTALWHLIEHDANGHAARFERFVASMLHVIASGEKIDKARTPTYGQILEELYENPFKRKKKRKQPETAAEIKDYICGLVTGLIEEETRRDHHGSDDAGGENRPG